MILAFWIFGYSTWHSTFKSCPVVITICSSSIILRINETGVIMKPQAKLIFFAFNDRKRVRSINPENQIYRLFQCIFFRE